LTYAISDRNQEMAMGKTVRLDEIHLMTVDEFLAMPQSAFGSAWRYELVNGLPVAQAAPSDEHAMIAANLAAALTNRLRGNRDCAPLVGGAVIPSDKQRRTARIPDATVRCGEKSVAMFEIVSPTDGITTELRAKRRRDIKSVDGAQVLVEIEQDAPVIHIHRRVGDFWVYDDVIGVKEILVLEAIAMEIPLSEIYDRLFEGSEPVEDELDVGSADGAS
jgi:Uma2 family endonuclease